MNLKPLTTWISQCGHHKAQPVVVTIGQSRFEGCYYIDFNCLTPCLYLLGDRPDNHRRCFKWGEEEWYLAYWFNLKEFREEWPTPAEEMRVLEHHPFGDHFQLHHWDIPSGESIDHGEPKPYLRIPMSVEFVGEKGEVA